MSISKSKKFLVGGITDIEGKWHGVFDTHYPCDGTPTHSNCVTIERHLSKAFDTKEEAIAFVYETKDSSGVEGWEVVGPKA